MVVQLYCIGNKSGFLSKEHKMTDFYPHVRLFDNFNQANVVAHLINKIGEHSKINKTGQPLKICTVTIEIPND